MSFYGGGKLAVRPALHRLLVPFGVVRPGFVGRQMQWRTPSGVVSHGASPVPAFDGGRRFCSHDPPLCAAQLPRLLFFFFFFFKKPHQTFPAASSTTTSLSVRWCSAGPQRKTRPETTSVVKVVTPAGEPSTSMVKVTPQERSLVVGKASRGRRKWVLRSGAMLASAVAGGLLLEKYEAIPYSGRYHLVVVPLEVERELGNNGFGRVKEEWGSRLLPPDHPQSVRVREVFRRLLAAMEEELNLGSGGGDRVLQGRRRVFTRHLRGMEWEVVVVKDDRNIACSESGGKIVVFTGFLDLAQSEVELAFVIGHEMGHVAARHVAEALTVAYLAHPVFPLLAKFDVGARVITYLQNRHPFCRRREKEADLIGLFLSSSAGYDPRVVPDFCRRLGSSEGIWEELTATHPSGTARAKHLSKPKVMKEAIARFEAAKNRNIK